MKQLVALSLLVGVVTAVAHWPSLDTRALTFDDGEYLTNNPLVGRPSWESVRRFWTEIARPSTVPGYYQPLTMTSLMVDTALGGSPDNLRPYHRTSLVLHVVNAILVFIVLFQLLRAAIPAAIAAMLFGIHPLAVESICWVGERKTLLATGLALASLVAYLSHARRGKGWGRLAVSIALFALAMLAKPSVIALPIMMLILDSWPLRRLDLKAWVEKTPFALIAVTGAVVTYISQSNTYGVTLPVDGAGARPIALVCHNLTFYLYKTFWPTNMSAYYPFPMLLDSSNYVVGSGFGIIAFTVSMVFIVKARPGTREGWFIFLVAIAPALGVVGFHPVIAADRHLYFPVLGLLIPLTMLFDWLLRRKSFLLPVIACAAFILATRQTRKTIAHWRDSVSLFTYFTQVAPDAPTPHARLGAALLAAGHPEAAIPALTRSLDLRPNQPTTLRRLGEAQITTGHLLEGIKSLQEAVKLQPKSFRLRRELAWAHVAGGDLQAAMEQFKAALEIRPRDPTLLHELKMLRDQLDENPTTRPTLPTSFPTTSASPG